MGMTKAEAASHKFIWNLLREQGYGTYAKIFSKLDLHLTKNPQVVGYMTPTNGSITINDQLDQDQVSVIIRHEILHGYLLHEKRLLDHLAKKHGIDPDDLDDIKIKELKQELYKNKRFNIAGDYEISNLSYTDDDKYNIRHIKLYGQELCGLVTEDEHPEWLNYSVEQMYDALNDQMEDEKDDMQDDIQNQDGDSEGESGDSEGDSEGSGGQGQGQSGDGDEEESGEGSGMQQGGQQGQSSSQSGNQRGRQSGSDRQGNQQGGNQSGNDNIDKNAVKDAIKDAIKDAAKNASYDKDNKVAQKNKDKAIADMKKAMSKLPEAVQDAVREAVKDWINDNPKLKEALEENPELADAINDALGGDVAGKKKPQIGDHPEDEESKRIEDEEEKNRKENDVTNRTEEEEKARIEDVKKLLADEEMAERAQEESTTKVAKDRAKRREKEIKKELDKYKSSHGIEAFTIALNKFIAKETKDVKVGTYNKLNKTYNANTGAIIRKGKVNKPSGHIPKINVYYDQSGSWSEGDIEVADSAISVIKKKYVDKGLIKLDIYYFSDHVHTSAQAARDEGGTSAGVEVAEHIQKTKADNVIIFTDSDFDAYVLPPETIKIPGGVFFLWKGGNRARMYAERIKGKKANEQFDIRMK